MKRKFSLLINIATLVLCVCAIAIGVYSAKTASLNVGGSVGFVAHNCEIELNGSIVACEDSNATETKQVTIPQTFIGRGAVPSTYSLNLNKTFSGSESGKMYFSDMFENGKTVIVTLTIKNVSAFDITAKANMPTITGAVTTVVKLGETVINEYTSEEGKSIDLSINGTTILEIAITLNSTDNNLATDIDISGTLFNFEKKSAFAGYNVTIQTEEYTRSEHQFTPSISTTIKFDTAPTSEDDYDFYVDYCGDVYGELNFTNKTKMYVWGDLFCITLNGENYNISSSYYTGATCIDLTQNSSVIAYYSP